MKKIFLTLLCVFAIIIILFSPQTVAEGVRAGISLNLYSVIPSLLPFMILTNIMLKYNLCEYISYIFMPFLSKIFHISSNGCFATIIGFSCGYPMGAKIIGELYSNNMISKLEACYLITFCNNCSISFLLNYIIYDCLGDDFSVYLALILIYGPPIITGFINKFFFKHNTDNITQQSQILYIQNPIFSAIKSISILAVYVICFTAIANWIETLTFVPQIVKCYIVGFTEITSGANFVVSLMKNEMFKIFSIFACTVFGGLSIMFQSFEQLPEQELKKYYIIGKLEQLIIYCMLFGIIFFKIR